MAVGVEQSGGDQKEMERSKPRTDEGMSSRLVGAVLAGQTQTLQEEEEKFEVLIRLRQTVRYLRMR